MLRTAAVALAQLLTSTTQVLHKVRVDAIAILGEAQRHTEHPHATVCVADQPGTFAMLSADKIEGRVAQALDLLYNQAELWKRSMQAVDAKSSMIQDAYQSLRTVQTDLSALVQVGIDTQPDLFCISIPQFVKFISTVAVAEQRCRRLKAQVDTKLASAK